LWSKEACRKSDIDLKAMLFSTFYQRIVDEGFSEVKEIANALTVFKVIGGARRELDSHALCLDTTGITTKEVRAKIRKRMNTDSVPEVTIESEEEYVEDEKTPENARTVGSGLREVVITTVEEPGANNKAHGRTKRKRSPTAETRTNLEPCHLSFKEIGVKLGKVFSEVTGTETGRRHIQELMKLGVIQKITFRKDYHEIFASLADEDLEISEGLQTKVEAIEGKLAEETGNKRVLKFSKKQKKRRSKGRRKSDERSDDNNDSDESEEPDDDNSGNGGDNEEKQADGDAKERRSSSGSSSTKGKKKNSKSSNTQRRRTTNIYPPSDASSSGSTPNFNMLELIQGFNSDEHECQYDRHMISQDSSMEESPMNPEKLQIPHTIDTLNDDCSVMSEQHFNQQVPQISP
jgi:hypothetical protein